MMRDRIELKSLTGLRAIAALLVFLSHIGFTGKAVRFVDQGRVAVAFFFMLSGFVLMWVHDDQDTPMVFYRKRFARIYPAFLVAWLAGIVLTAYVGDQPMSAGKILVGGSLLQDWTTNGAWIYAINGPAWSLSCEAFFYLTFPLWASRIACASPRSRARFAIGLVAAILLIGASAQLASPGGDFTVPEAGMAAWLVRTCPITQLLVFAAGALMAVELRAGRRINCRWLVAAALALLGYLIPGFWISHLSSIAIPCLPFALLLYVAAQADVDGDPSLLRHPALVWGGTASYSFYLVHDLWIRLFERWFVTGVIVRTVFCLAISMLLAAALHYGIEKPWQARLRPRSGAALDDVVPSCPSDRLLHSQA